MHQAQQALDDREAVAGGRRTDGGEHRRPAAADKGIGHEGHSRRQRRAERSRDTGVVGAPLAPGMTLVPDALVGRCWPAVFAAIGSATPAAIASTERIAVDASSTV